MHNFSHFFSNLHLVWLAKMIQLSNHQPFCPLRCSKLYQKKKKKQQPSNIKKKSIQTTNNRWPKNLRCRK